MQRLKYFASLLILSISFQSVQAQVVINEFMATNSSAISDPDYDKSADWIELYNNSLTTTLLTGYYLTDNISDTLKWAIPNGTSIPPGGYLLIWADGLNIGLHASFKLSSLGEEIGLYNSSLDLVDSSIFNLQATDVSYGRTQDAGTDWAYFANSTPGATNNIADPSDGITYYEPVFSIKGGFYSETQLVDLTSLGGTIRYTLDGRAPTIADPIFEETIVINDNNFLRARVFEEGFIPGPTITHSYFFEPSFVERGLPVFSLVTDPDYFWDAEIGLYVQDFKPDWEQPLNIEFFENDGNNQAVFNERAGVKVNGQNSWVLPQKMLGIYFRNQYGSGNLEYPLFHDRERAKYDDFILRAGGSDWAKTLLRDALCQSLPQENAVVGHQGFRQSIAFINGEYMGVHNLRSRLNDGFIEENYGMASGTYDLIENDGVIGEGDALQYITMDSIFNLNLTIEENFALLDSIVDLENLTDYFATEMWTGNSSWGHNVVLWKPKNTGKWQFLFGDLDRGFTGGTQDPISSFSVPVGTSGYNYARTWLQNIFQNDDFAYYFAQRFTDHMYTSFHPTRVQKVIDQFEAPIIPEMSYHADRWAGTTSSYGNGIESVEFWEGEMSEIREYTDVRQSYMMNDIQNTFNLDSYSNLGTSSFPPNGGDIILNDFKIPELPWTGPYFQNMPLTLTASPSPGYEFIGWSNFDYEYIVNLAESWNYFDQGEGIDADWNTLSYDDSTWSSGTAELGYGDGDETTTISYGPDPDNKHITTYFRKTFEYDGISENISGILNIRRDDGAVIYINGTEVARSNMPDSEITYFTMAIEAAADEAEDNLFQFLLDIPLVNGTNVIAVEIHQVQVYSSDISFDLSLQKLTPSEDIISTETALAVNLTGDNGYVARYQETGSCILPNEIAENTNLTIDCSPYMASSDTRVLEDVILSIDPGVEIWFSEGARMIVEGTLDVNGEEGNLVVFKANESYGAESWDNLSFENSTGINTLSYLEIKQATEGIHPVHNRAAISSWYSSVEMDNMTLTNNFSNPIFAQYSDITLTNSTIHSDVTGDLINVKYGTASIDNCIFIGNDQPDTDAIDYDDIQNGEILNTSIHGFYGFNSDGIDLGEQCEDIYIANCFINDCTDKGVSIGQSSTATFENVTIVNCNLGFGVKDLGVANIDHATLYSNVTGIAAFEKNPGFGGGTINVTNSLLSNSSTSPLFADSVSTAFANNNFYDTDTMLDPSNLWMDPIFENAPFYNFQIGSGSPAIDAGTDGLNLGTNSFLFSADSKVMFSDIQYFHPIDADQEYIKIWNAGDFTIDLSGYTLSIGVSYIFPAGIEIAPNEKIMLVRDLNLFPLETGQILEWNSGQLANEGETLLLSDNYGIVVDYVHFIPMEPWPIPTLEDQFISLVSSDLDNHFGTSWILDYQPLSVTENDSPVFNLFPNPVTDDMHISSSIEMHNYIIYDVTGKLISSNNINGNQAVIKADNLHPGLYLLVIDGVYSKTFLKN